MVLLSRRLKLDIQEIKIAETPHLSYIAIRDSVCLSSLSVAPNYDISIDFFSCGY